MDVTPGPWNAGPRSTVIDQNGVEICVVRAQNREANRRAIMAIPGMIEALQACLDNLADRNHSKGYYKATQILGFVHGKSPNPFHPSDGE